MRTRVHAGIGIATPAPCPADIDQNGSVGITDLLLILQNWG